MTDPGDLADQVAALRDDNARLRRLLDEAGMPDSLRHGLRNTVAMLRTIMHRSAESAQDVETYVTHLDGRLSALLRVQSITDMLGEVDLHALIADELLAHLVREGEQATIAGPRIRLRPKPALSLALALHELTSNAIEHGTLALPHGRVTVSWQIERGESEPILPLQWDESGGTGVTEPARRGFGTTLLEDALAYELDSQTTLVYRPDGLCCRVRIPFTARIGRLAGPETAQDEDDESV
ncbi:sensor histidine kinase [Methylobacterium sp. J-030]|uniref:sensor histidine kinase n=1 Tax=Methylobacterium sp. J-030 TaxID=2836627 RepID=UPI001FBA503D|nr:sensor histidine kinase [Methylobacterium sp. J-030]MCJ2071297.1 sensor histidine kinase [Methylobacterium sp. J-030]